WQPYIPLGKLTLLAADPGAGKTSLALHLASQLSQGLPLPPSDHWPLTTDHSPAATLLLSPDDNAADTLRPRLESLHANLDLIHALPDLPSLLPPKPHPLADPNAPTPLQQLDAACASIPNLKLLIIDPITHYLGLTDRSLPSSSSSSATSILHALAQLAHKHQIAILLTSRLPRNLPAFDPHAPNRHINPVGSLAFSSTPRSILLLTRYSPPTQMINEPSTMPNPPIGIGQSAIGNPPNRLLLSLKSNLATPPAPLPLTIADTITFHPPLAPPAPAAPKPAPPRPAELSLQSATEWLAAALAPGPQPAAALVLTARSLGIPYALLHQAKTTLHATSHRHPHSGKWFWQLPDALDPLPPDPLAEALSEMAKNLIHNGKNSTFFAKHPRHIEKKPHLPPRNSPPHRGTHCAINASGSP
ncbi:MAG TPA: AAA family ATPase, partial [Phycisphaerae bacterium]|nr:AAA family ATPase [Phycisphaerae bacterium]